VSGLKDVGPDLPSVRAFVAIRLDDATRSALRAEIDRLRAAAPYVAWVPAENLHVTLKFLGHVEANSLDEVTAGLEAAVRDSVPFDLEIRGLGAFPTPTRARVVWAGVRAGREAMGALAGRIEAALEPVGFPREARPFSAHVTLGRVRVPRKDPRLARLIEGGAALEFGALRVGALWLMRSDLSSRGARYSELAVVSLPPR